MEKVYRFNSIKLKSANFIIQLNCAFILDPYVKCSCAVCAINARPWMSAVYAGFWSSCNWRRSAIVSDRAGALQGPIRFQLRPVPLWPQPLDPPMFLNHAECLLLLLSVAKGNSVFLALVLFTQTSLQSVAQHHGGDSLFVPVKSQNKLRVHAFDKQSLMNIFGFNVKKQTKKNYTILTG